MTIPVDETAVLIVWPSEDDVLQLVWPCPLEVEASKVPALEGAIVRLNHQLSLPGFGFNHETGVLYDRLSVWLQGHQLGTLSPKEVLALAERVAC